MHPLFLLSLLAAPAALAQDLCPSDPDKADPGVCGCQWRDLDLDGVPGAETCVHRSASVDPTAQIGAGAIVGPATFVGAGASIGADAFVAPKAHVGAGAVLGDRGLLGRRSVLGDRSVLGPDTIVQRSVTIGQDVDASPGALYVGYGVRIGDRAVFTGPGVRLANLVTIGSDAVIGGQVRIGRGATIGVGAWLGQGARIGPDAFLEDGVSDGTTATGGVVIGDGARIRRDAWIGAGSQVGDQATVGRGVTLGSDVSIGTLAVVRGHATIGARNVIDDRVIVPPGTVLDDVPVDPRSDRPPIVVITSPGHGVDVSGGTVTLTGTLSDDVGIDRLTLRIDDGPATDLTGFTQTGFTTTVTVPDGTLSLRITAWDTAGQSGSDLLFVSDCDLARPFSKTWTGAGSTDWHDPANWSPAGVPTASDDVLVCGGVPDLPILTADAEVRDLWVDVNAELATAGFTLTAWGDVTAGLVSGSGTLHLPTTQRLRGTVPNLDVRGRTTLDGFTRVTGALSLLGGDRLSVGGRVLQVDGPFSQFVSAPGDGLNLYDADTAILDGDAYFDGNADMTALYGGTLHLRGNLATGSTQRRLFSPSNTTVVADGTAPQTFHFYTAGASYNRFRHLVVASTADVTFTRFTGPGLYLSGNLTIAGRFTQATTGTVSGNLTIEAGGVLVNDGSLTYGGTYTNLGTLVGNAPTP